MANPAYQKTVGVNGTRYTGTVNAGTSAYITDVFDLQNYAVASASVQSVQNLTLWFLCGTAADTITALPHGQSQSITGAAAAEGTGGVKTFTIPAGCTVGRFQVRNATGSNSDVIADCGVRAVQ